jgi:ABC-type polysaccharide/polyol phosphate export permease
MIIICLAIIGGVLLPALLAAVFSKQENKRFTNFVVFLLVLVIFTIVPAIFANMNGHEKYLWLFAWNPLIFLTMVDESGFVKSQLLNTVLVLDFIIVTPLVGAACVAYRNYRRIFDEARAGLTDTPDTAPTLSES